jgi:serine/threonine protein phosphatase PrpC
LRRAGIPLADITELLRERSPERLAAWVHRLRADAVRRQEALAVARKLLTSTESGTAGTQAGHSGREAMVRWHVAGRTETGHVRQDNEDAIVAREDLLVVADGMGGRPGGAVAAALAAELVGATFAGGSPDELTAAVRAANWVVWQRGSSTADLAGMGTTVCAVGVAGDGTLAIANVGDCRAYLIRQESLERLTQDHTVVAELVRDGRLTAAEAAGHPHRHVLTRALGVAPDLRIDTFRSAVAPGDRVLVCSDGAYIDVAEEEFTSSVLGSPSPQALVDSVVDLALAHGGRDNVSVVAAETRA